MQAEYRNVIMNLPGIFRTVPLAPWKLAVSLHSRNAPVSFLFTLMV